RVFARRVLTVALALLRLDLRNVAVAAFVRAARGADPGVRVEIELHAGVREDDGPHVTSLGDDAAGRRERPLPRDDRSPDAGQGRDHGRRLRNVGTADLSAHVLVVEEHLLDAGLLAHLDPRVLGRTTHR